MRYIKLFFLIVLLSFINVTLVNAQLLTESEKVTLQERVKQKVEEFQSSLSKIVLINENSTASAHKNNKEQVALLLNLFIGRCEPYEYYDEELGINVKNSGVKMQTSSVKSGKGNNDAQKVSNQKMKNYIYRFYNPETGKSRLPYTKIIIEAANAVRVDNIERVGDHYECMAYFCQKFIGYRDGKVYYSDVTSKKIRCYIKSIPTNSGIVWDAKLGDVYVLSTEKY